MMHAHLHTTRVRTAAGFSMMEVLVAIGIFALGFVAVAAIFPAAAIMQRGTAQDVQSRHLERNARAIIEATWPSEAQLIEVYYDDATVPPTTDDRTMVRPFRGGSLTLDDFWTLDVRSYPAHITDSSLRDFYWVPLLRDANDDPDNHDWWIYVFIVARSDGNYVRDTTETDWQEQWANPNDAQVNTDTWLVPGVHRLEVTIDEDDEQMRRLDFANTPQGSEPPGARRILDRNDWLLYERTGQAYRVTEADDAGIRLNARIDPGDDPSEPQYVWYAHPHREVDGRQNYRQRPAKRLFRIADPTSD